MTFRDLLKKKNNDDSSQSTSSVESSSATIDDTQSKNKTMRSTLGQSDRANNKSMLDYLRTQEAVGQEEEEQTDTAQASAGVDIMSRYYNSSQLANKNAQNELSKSTFDSMKNKVDNIAKYYNGSNKLSDDMVSAYKTLSDNGYKSLEEVEENILDGDLPKDVTSAYKYITDNLNKISSTDQQSTDTLGALAKQYVAKHGYTEDTEDYQAYIQNAEDVENYYKNSAKEIQNAMSDFDTEQEYKSAVAQAEEDAKTSDDLQKEYDKKKAEYDSTWEDFNKEYAEIGGSYNNNPFTTQGKNANKKLQERTNQRAELGELQKKIDKKKELENEKKYYTDFRKQNPEVAKTLDAYYDMQSYEEEHSKDSFDTYNKDALKEKLEKGKSPTDSLYTDDEKKAIETNFNSLKTLDGWNVDQIYKYYKRAKNREKAEKENENIKDFADKHPIASTVISTLNMIPSAFESSPKQVASNIDKWTGGDGYYNPEESAVYQNNLLQQEVASNIDNPLGRLAYQQGVSLVDNAIRMGIAYANPAVGLSMMGAEVATQGFNDTVENGGSVEQALFTGLAYAGVEVLTEGVSLGKLKSFKNGGVKEFKSILKNAGKQILTEASEEVSATLLDSVADEIINGSLSQLETEYDRYIDSGMSETEAGQAVMLNYGGQIIQDAIGGALMGGISGTAVNTSQYRRNIKAGKSISSLDNIDTVKNLAKHYGLNDSVTDYESNPTDARLGSLQSEAYEKATESMPSEKEFKKVIKKANLASDEKVVANKLTNGENLTDDDLEKIKKSESLKSLLANDVVNQAKTARFNQQTALLSADTKLFTPSLIEFNAEKSDADANSNKAETLNKFLSENAKDMTINTDTVDKMKDAYNGLEDKIEPDTFAMEYARFYNQGVRAVAFQSLNSTASQLPYNVQVSAYEDGLNKYTTALKAGNALSKLQQEWKDKTNGYAKGTVDNSALEGIELNDEQKATANYISKFADFGLNVKLYASQADENGNFSLENGAYNSATNTVSIDLNAKRKTVDQALKQGAIIATFGHELTHIAEHAPTEYAELTKAIRDTVGTDIFNITVDKHRSILEDYNSKSWQKMSESEKEISATKEAIAEFSSDLVNQAKILEKMSKENPSAGKKFINAIKNVIAKIKKFITGDRGKTEEARLLESTAKDLQGIVDKYEKAVIEGLKNQNVKIYAKKSSTESNNSIEENNTEIQNNTRSGSFLSDSEVDNQYSEAIKNNDIETAQKLVDEKAMSWGAYSENGKTPTKLYHGTESFGFTAFDLSKMDDGASIFLTNKPEIASTYSGVETENNIQHTINSIKAISSKVKSMSIYEIEKSLNSLTHGNTNPELRADNDDLHYSIVDENAVNKFTAKVNSEIDYLIDYLKGREGYFKKFPKIDYDTKYSDFVEMLKNRQYNKIANPLFNLIESTKFDSTEEEQKFRKIEKDSYELVRILEVYNNSPIIISKDSQSTIFGVFNENKAKDYLKGKLTEQVQKGNYSLFAKIENPLIIDASKSNWNEIDVKSVINTPFGDAIKADYGEDYFDYGTQHLSTREVSKYAKQAGYDGVIFKNLKDNGGRNSNVSLDTVSDVYIAFNPNNVKSADAITYDNNGKVIPLSERFDGNEDDIRYNISDDDFLSDDEYNDLFDFDYNEEEKNIDFKKAVDENHPELTIEQIYHHSANNVKEGLLASKGIKPDAKKINNMVKSVMRSYYINPNAEIDSLVTEYIDSLNAVIDSVQNDNSEFNEAFKKFVMKCREALQYSTQLDEQHEAWAKEIRDELKGTTLLIPDNAIDTIKENYGSVGKYRKVLFGKINVKLERNAKGINGKAVGSYIEDIGSHLEELGGRSLMIEDGFDWDSDSGYQMLDRIMNYELAPHYVSTYGGNIQSESTIDASAIQMAFDTTAEYFKLQSKQAVTQKNVDKRKLSEVAKALKQAQENQEILRKKIIEEYEAKLAEKNNISIQITAGDFLSTREALAQALETTTINASERNTVKTYQQGLEQMNKLNDKLNEIDSKIKAINAKDNISKSDKAEIASLEKVKLETKEKIVNKDKSLLKLESTEAMRNILKYETSKKIARVREQKNERIAEIRKQETQKRKDAVAKLRKQKNDKIDDIILKNREKRKADSEKRKDNQDWSHSISEIKKYSKKLLDAVLHPTEKMYIPYGLNEPIKSITSTLLDSINLDNDTKMSDNLRKLSQQLEQVNQSDEHYGDFYNAYNEEIIEEIKGFADYLDDRLEGVKIKKQTQGESLIEGLTHEEAKEIEQIVKDVYYATRDAVKQIGRQDAITNYESGLRIINQTRELGDVKLNVIDSLLDQVLSPMRLMAKYTGYNADAELMYHINALNEGTEKYNMFKMLAEKPLNDFIKENPKEYENFKNDVIEIKYRDNKNVAQTVKMTKSQGLQILMSWTREHTEDSHLDHMERGGVTLLDAEQISKGNYEKAFAQRKTIRGINLSFISAVQSQMGDFENHYRELAETLFNEVSNAYINDTSAILCHRDIATEKYYIPFAVNKDFLSAEIDGLKYDATIVNKGMLKTTKRNAPQALNIAGLDSVISKHIRDVGQYYGYAVPIRNLNKALNVKLFDTNENGHKIATDSVRNALRETFNSDKPIQFIEQVMTDLQTSRKSNSQTEKAINKIVRAVRDNMITSALKGSVSVVIKQGASLYTASSILSMRSVSVGAVKGIQQIARKGGWKQLTDEIDAHTAGHYMRRIGLSSMEIEAMKDSWLGKKLPTALNPAKWIQGTDCITTALHWVATKEEVSRLYKEQGKADQIGSDEYFDEVTKLYDQILEETQPMYDSLHRGEIQKNSNELLKSVFMFKTQPLQNTGILYDAIMDYQANKDNAELRDAKKQKLAKAVSSQMVSALTFVAMTFIASLALHKPERYKDENDEVTLSSVLERLGIDWAETGFSVLVPIGGAELASFIENQINGKDYDFASDNVVSMLNDFTSSIGDFNQNVIVALAQGNFDLDKAKDALWGLSVDGLAFFKGFPLKNYSNIINGIFSNLSDAISGHSTYFGSSGGRKGSEYANSYDALIDNNPEKAKQQLETFYNEKYEEQITRGETTTEAKKKAQTSVRTALTTQYKKEYQKAFLNNDRDKMQKISKKLQKSGYMKWNGKSLSTVLGEWTKSAQEDSNK
nr:MAG TPA_asm: chromosome segregation ATPase [Caudoviricetes sp.]